MRPWIDPADVDDLTAIYSCTECAEPRGMQTDGAAAA